MFRNYLKIAFRNLVKNRFYTSINIIGLATGLSVAILILLWVENEIGYDRFHNDANNIYRVLSNMGSGSTRQIWEKSHAPLAVFAKKTIPEIKNAVRIKDNDDLSMFSYQDKTFKEKRMAYVDPSFFKMFDFDLIKGKKSMPFVNDQSVILTRATAKRYFGDEDPVNKIMEAEDKQQFVVSGVLEDFPENSSLKYEMLFPMTHFEKNYLANNEGKTIDQDWGNFSYTTFLQLPSEASIETMQEKLAVMLRSNFKDIGIKDPYALQPLRNMHLYKTDGSEGRMQIVRIFLIVGILILVIACINYVNLSTARAILRAKEVSVRKMIGAEKFQLFIQFFIETAVIFIFAAIAALVITQLMMPVYNKIAGENIEFRLTDTNVWLLIALTVMSTLVFSSVYPAWLLSSFEPLKVLKGRMGSGIRAASFRKVLVTVQFVFSVALIAGTLVIDGQLNYIHQKELGYDKQNVFSLGLRDMQQHAASVKNEISKIVGVHGVSFASDNLVNIGITTSKTDWDGKDPEQRFFVHPLSVDKDFIPVFKLQLTKGVGFTGIASDSAHYILNETAIREAGITDPIGKRFSLWGKQGTIIGVVQDFHFKSLKQKIEPSVFSYSPENSQMFVKTSGKDASKAIEAVAELWKQYNGSYPFEFSFLDDDYDNLYKSEQRTGMLFALLSIVAVVISCLGLFGLATYTAQVKIKEIGIRKVLGGSVSSIIQILAKDFIRLVLIAILIATPISWYAMNYWLQDYTYRIDLEWWMFVLAGLIAIVITLITVGFQSVRAAMMNPVKSLRTE